MKFREYLKEQEEMEYLKEDFGTILSTVQQAIPTGIGLGVGFELGRGLAGLILGVGVASVLGAGVGIVALGMKIKNLIENVFDKVVAKEANKWLIANEDTLKPIKELKAQLKILEKKRSKVGIEEAKEATKTLRELRRAFNDKARKDVSNGELSQNAYDLISDVFSLGGFK